MKKRNWESKDSESPFPRRGFGSALFPLWCSCGARGCFSDSGGVDVLDALGVAERNAIDVTILPHLSWLSSLFCVAFVRFGALPLLFLACLKGKFGVVFLTLIVSHFRVCPQ